MVVRSLPVLHFCFYPSRRLFYGGLDPPWEKAAMVSPCFCIPESPAGKTVGLGICRSLGNTIAFTFTNQTAGSPPDMLRPVAPVGPHDDKDLVIFRPVDGGTVRRTFTAA